MAVDYYKLLQVRRHAKDDDLKKATQAKFKQISEAYDVLSDPRKRVLYDQYGEEGMKRRVDWSKSGRRPEDVFSEVFGSRGGDFRGPEDVLSAMFGGRRDMSMSDDSDAGWSQSPRSTGYIFQSFGIGDLPRKAAAIEKTLPCSLEELYNGTTKKMKISRDVVSASGRTSTVEEVLTIEIKPGWKKGTKITFEEKGDDVQPGVIPADVVFIIDEKPHSCFERDDNDLVVAAGNISLAEALTGHTQLRTLDGRNLNIRIDTISSHTHEEVVKGEGMPISKEPSKKGNLILEFNIEFPKLTSEQKTGVKRFLTSS